MTAGILDRAHTAVADRAAAATDPHVTVGDRAVLVTATLPDHGGVAGLAHRPDGEARDVPTDSVATLAALATTGDARIERAVGVATLNALSEPDIDWRSGDPMAALSSGVDVVTTVGLFRPAFRKFDDATVRVIERDPPASVDAPADATVETYRPTRCESAFKGTDVCFLTGSTLVYGGIDRYLRARDAGVEPVVLVGATASHVPGPAFEAGVDVVAGARVTDPDRVRARVLAGDCGTDLHDSGVVKVYVANGTVPGIDLETERREETRP